MDLVLCAVRAVAGGAEIPAGVGATGLHKVHREGDTSDDVPRIERGPQELASAWVEDIVPCDIVAWVGTVPTHGYGVPTQGGDPQANANEHLQIPEEAHQMPADQSLFARLIRRGLSAHVQVLSQRHHRDGVGHDAQAYVSEQAI